MAQKRKYKNPYCQTQSELAEWLSLFARDHSTTEVADALVERYPERTTGDPKADHRWAKEAICTVNPNDNRYNAAKWDKQFWLTQANYHRELEKRHRRLASKAVSALNAAYDSLESTISALSPKEQISLVPKALLTLNQAIGSVQAPPPSSEQNDPDEDTEAKAQADTEKEEMTVEEAREIITRLINRRKAQNILRKGKSFDEVTAETGMTEEEIKEHLMRKKVEHEVLGMYKNGMDVETIQLRTKLGYAYIDSIIDNAVNDRISGFDSRRRENSEARAKTRSLLKNGDDEDLDFDSDADTASDDRDDRPPPRGAEWESRE